MREVSEEEAWNFYWTDMSVSVDRAKEMKRFQRINHFPGMLEICRKDLLARNLNRMQKIYPKEYNFFPKTWCLPADFGEALNYSKTHKNKTFIIKPECGSQGRGIYLTKSLKEVKPTDKLICQVHACFEILGFDILLDQKLHPYILEVNHSPSFHTDTQLDREVKENLLTDTFTMLNIWQCDKKRVLEEDRKRIRERLLQTNKFSESLNAEDKEPEKSPWQTQIQWEETHLGNFRRVYPEGDQYAALFQQPTGSLYTGTASSRARGDCARIQREQFEQVKAKAEALKKPSQLKPIKESEKKEDEISAAAADIITEKPKVKTRANKEQKRKDNEEKDKIKTPLQSQQPAVEKEIKPTHVLCSFEPDPIIEKEERERVNLLAQRDFLIRSYGMLEQIYLAMKKMGTLRPEDERKYGLYGRLTAISNSSKKV
ncbi:unnamed protein product [Parnassius apollo]|uniref:(apollo) hypothetical protein n=1 Tax=Parnassius apollo TaxID=110799 RepID=A0A8S3WLL0_PARAO|nr:unnamed protein product [Parnassius apollo]